MYKYNGKELQDELGLNLYDYGARNYDPAIGRWMNIDPLAELYDYVTTYGYVLNSPIIYIDPDGMRINFAKMIRQEGGTTAMAAILLDLSEQTGLTLSVNFNNNEAFLEYETDENGNPIISKDAEYGNEIGSSTARQDLKNSIDDTRILNVELVTQNMGSATLGLNVVLDPQQIDTHISTVSENLNEKTLGYGMTFLHELQHTDLRGHLTDTKKEFATGPTVDRINIIRQELDENSGGYNKPYGIRKYYIGSQSKAKSVNKNYESIISIISFTVINKEGEKKSASLKTKYIRKKS